MAFVTPKRVVFNGSPVDEFKAAKKTGYQSSVPLMDVIRSNASGMRLSFGVSFSANLGVGEAVQFRVEYRIVDCGATFGAWRATTITLRNTEVSIDNVYRLEVRIPSDHVSGMDRGFMEFAFWRLGTGTDNFPGDAYVHWILCFEDDTPADNTIRWILCGTVL